MKPSLLKEILEKIKSAKIGIIGDFCLDAYWFVDKSKSEVSIETGRPTEPVRIQKYSLGGAGNVANNLASMQIGDIRVFGVTGNDPFGSEMISIMKKAGINTSNMLIQEGNWSTHVYIKPHIGEEEQNRIDFGNFNRLSDETADQLIHNLKEESEKVDLVIINQQVLSGLHTEYFRMKLVEVINSFPDKIFIADSRNFTDYYTGAYRKMNDSEAISLCHIRKGAVDTVPYADVISAAEQLYERYRKPLFITRGSRGSVVTDDKGISEISSLMIIGVLTPLVPETAILQELQQLWQQDIHWKLPESWELLLQVLRFRNYFRRELHHLRKYLRPEAILILFISLRLLRISDRQGILTIQKSK